MPSLGRNSEPGVTPGLIGIEVVKLADDPGLRLVGVPANVGRWPTLLDRANDNFFKGLRQGLMFIPQVSLKGLARHLGKTQSS